MSDPVRHLLLTYTYVPDVAERRDPHRPAHLARIAAAKDGGALLMAGATGDPPHGAVFVFATEDRELVERFAHEDPYVQAGLVPEWRIDSWTVV